MLVSTGSAAHRADNFEQRNAEHDRRVLALLRSDRDFDIVHDESGFFWRNAGNLDVPMLLTLHLRREFYPTELLLSAPEPLCFNCVSLAQQQTFVGVPRVLGVVENGIALDRFLSKSKSEITSCGSAVSARRKRLTSQ
jgi:hypothetical protein